MRHFLKCLRQKHHDSEPDLMWGKSLLLNSVRQFGNGRVGPGGSKDCFGNLTMNVSVKNQGWWQDGVSTQPPDYNRIILYKYLNS